MNSNKIFIYGAPGVGKTTYSLRLQKELGYPLIEGDYLREVVAQKEKTQEEDPFVYVGVKDAFRYFGSLNEENVIKGLKAARKSMSPYVSKEISQSKDSLILEGAFLDPEELSKYGRIILILASDEIKHRSQYFQQREETDMQIENFQAARMIQSYLINEAKSYAVEILENVK
ncbi:AAA family ATPase [Candidatus Uhrbacteria bacterium]|nr:AAA family ATPase [Candidatus Uhrbacteria bacterium]